MKNIDTGLLILRVSLGVLMLFHGISKLIMGIGGIESLMENYGSPTLFAYGVYIGEVIAPILLIFGFRTRLAALIYAGTMLIAILLAHFGDVFNLNNSGGWAIELPALYLFGALTLFFTGGGRLTISSKNFWD